VRGEALTPAADAVGVPPPLAVPSGSSANPAGTLDNQATISSVAIDATVQPASNIVENRVPKPQPAGAAKTRSSAPERRPPPPMKDRIWDEP
jgi:hypothetical protein